MSYYLSFFFMQNTAYEMRISDWSSDVCSSDLSTGVIETHLIPYAQFCGIPPAPSALAFGILMGVNTLAMVAAGWLTDRMNRARSEERRVGKECVSTCRSRWSPDH